MTDDTLPQLLSAIQKSDDGDFLRVLAETTLNRLMDFDAENAIGAARHERSADRTTYRNGFRDRTLETRVGALDLKIPKFRTGQSYYPGFILEPRRLMEKALTAVIQEAWINGVSTRRVEELVQAMGMTGISKSQVSKLCKEIDERVTSFLERPLEGEWPYLWLDATYLKVRQGGRTVSVAAIIAVAANTDGRREIIGLSIGDSEAMVFWMEFLRSLMKRGLKGVKLVVSDAHEGLKAAATKVLQAGHGNAAAFTRQETCSRASRSLSNRAWPRCCARRSPHPPPTRLTPPRAPSLIKPAASTRNGQKRWMVRRTVAEGRVSRRTRTMSSPTWTSPLRTA